MTDEHGGEGEYNPDNDKEYEVKILGKDPPIYTVMIMPETFSPIKLNQDGSTATQENGVVLEDGRVIPFDELPKLLYEHGWWGYYNNNFPVPKNTLVVEFDCVSDAKDAYAKAVEMVGEVRSRLLYIKSTRVKIEEKKEDWQE